VNKMLVRLEIAAAELPAAGAKLLAGPAEAGEITSSVLSPESGKIAALAYVRTPYAAAGTTLSTAGQAAAIVLP